MKAIGRLAPVLGLTAAALINAPAGASHHQKADPARRAEMVAACTQTNQQYQFHRDRGDPEGYGALFADNAEFVIGKPVRGRDAIVKAMQERFAEQQTRHFVNVVQIEPISPDRARGLVYLMLVAAPQDNDQPAPVPGISLVAEYHDQYVMQDGKCLIQRRQVDLIFTRQPNN